MSLNRLVLVINASYEPVTVCSARRALTLLFKGAAQVEAVSGHVVRTSKLSIPLPSVIRLTRYRKIPRMNRSVSRKGIILRDANTCQYCATKLQARELTLDHVIPKSRGGQSTWENLVAACYGCNNRKAQRTPEEAGFVLLKTPRQITMHSKHKMLQGDNQIWERYLFC